MRYSDRPVSRSTDDVLARAPFALSLARSIDQLVIASEGFVIALLGEWGAGKSSVMEMTLRFLTHLEMERASSSTLLGELGPAPQSLQQLESLAVTFDKIRDQVASYDSMNLDFTQSQRNYRIDLFQSWLGDPQEAKRADRYWRLLCKTNENRRTIQVRFSPWLIAGRAELASALFSELARALGEKLGEDITVAFASILNRLSEFAPVAAAGLDLSTGFGAGKLVSAGLTWSSKLTTSSIRGPTLEELRETLKGRLRLLQDQRILIIIDDLDRLTPPEAVEMVSLIKSLGDLPNVIYLLSYDEKNLSRLISEETKLDGREFLSKIVQYSVELPPIGQDRIGNLFESDLIAILGQFTHDEQRRLGIAWYFVIRHYLRTPRDVRLYINSIAVALSAERDHIDVIDLLLIEILRLHEPDIYRWVRENIESLTNA